MHFQNEKQLEFSVLKNAKLKLIFKNMYDSS